MVDSGNDKDAGRKVRQIVISNHFISMLENVYQFYDGLREYEIETWISNAGFGNYGSVADQDLDKIGMMLNA